MNILCENERKNAAPSRRQARQFSNIASSSLAVHRLRRRRTTLYTTPRSRRRIERRPYRISSDAASAWSVFRVLLSQTEIDRRHSSTFYDLHATDGNENKIGCVVTAGRMSRRFIRFHVRCTSFVFTPDRQLQFPLQSVLSITYNFILPSEQR